MNPTTLLILQYGLEYGPAAIELVRKLLAKKEPTDADWAELTDILKRTGRSYFETPGSTSTGGGS